MEYELQPLRIIAGWKVDWNTFYEVDPTSETMHYFEGSSLLQLSNYNLYRSIDLEWRPEKDVNGEFILRVINISTSINPKTKKEVYDFDWEDLYLEFSSKSRKEIIEKIELLMLQLPPFIQKK
ncbi:hypothetical protein [Urechidicola croceus]|uniref:Uncharacterized protein n=1 Tax=Urechidicola croceus TaxID=1850246 RepID=A0A1D8P952_9FLAO|nr:hypothetical protein [Urechidicola croceus]AOW21096.1 hypothetical protein LPB138_10585 [Urechidicola croceus]